MLPRKIGVRTRFLILSMFFTFLSCSLALAGTVVIKPGKFDHFTLQMPDRAVAGENFVVKVSVYDANKNLITNFSETGKEFRVDANGTATVQPSLLGASAFSGGIANILVNNKKAEKISFSIREAGGTVPVISRDIVIIPNKLDHFTLQSPQAVTAGNPFDVKVVAKDIFDNTVSDIDVGKNIKITSTGASSVKVLGTGALDFRSGMATAAFVSEKTGDVIVEFQDIISGSMGRTQPIQVNPGTLAYFKLQSPKTAMAGEPFELLIAAYDAFNNIVANYAAAGGGVRLTTTGSSKIEPASLNPADFRNGQATVKILYDKAEEIQIVARESNREQSGKTAEIQIVNAFPDHFVVLTPDTAVSGQKFKVKIEAYDRFNNLVKNFNLVGNEVLLSTSGSGVLSPSRLSPPDFVNGIALAEVMYDKAESFQISARMSSDKVPGRVMTSDRDTQKEVSHQRAAETPRMETGKSPEPEVKAARKEPKKEIKKEISKSQQAKREMPQPKAETKKEAPRKVETAKIPKEPVKKPAPEKQILAKKEIPPARPAEKKVVPEEVKKPVVEAAKKEPTAARTPEKKVIAEEAKKPAVEIAKKEEMKPVAPQLYNVKNVSIIEAKEKVMLVINITNPNGNLEYGDEIESKHGKDWLKLKMKPAVNSAGKTFRFKSAYIGEVMIEEDKTGGQNLVNMFIELIPSGLTYDIARIKNTLVITFSNP